MEEVRSVGPVTPNALSGPSLSRGAEMVPRPREGSQRHEGRGAKPEQKPRRWGVQALLSSPSASPSHCPCSFLTQLWEAHLSPHHPPFLCAQKRMVRSIYQEVFPLLLLFIAIF